MKGKTIKPVFIEQSMNANELAYELDNWYSHSNENLWNDAATMLRQQQAEIEEWKRKYKDMHNLATQAMSRVHELEKAQANEK